MTDPYMDFSVLVIIGCPVLSASNGYVSYNRGRYGDYRVGIDTEATYTCHGGYERTSGWEVRTCLSSGTWNGYPAVCTQGKAEPS